MDSITHIVLGATLGEIIAGKKIGKKAMLIGAVAQSLPDIDIVSAAWMTPTEYFLAHRGFTHSFLFVILASTLFPLVANYFRSTKMSFQHWILFFILQLLIHILLDSLNAYGVGWFEPFIHQRISFDVLFVADPFFSIWTCVSTILLVLLPSSSCNRTKWAMAAILLSLAYIGYAITNKSIINTNVHQTITLQKIQAKEFLTTPTPLNAWLWYVVIKTNDGYFIGYNSVFDETPISYQYISENDSLLNISRSSIETQQLIRLARRFYAVEQKYDTIVFNNLRFGQINGWTNPTGGFVFQYNIGLAGNSLMTVQRGRFSGWSKKTSIRFFNRIKGN